MTTKVDKKNAIRQGIIKAAIVYSQSLAGKTFLYVYGDEYFEVSFPVDHFLHLTGVETRLSAKDFYRNAKKAIPKGEPEFNMKASQAAWDQIMAPSTAAATTSVATDGVHPEVTDIPPAQ